MAPRKQCSVFLCSTILIVLASLLGGVSTTGTPEGFTLTSDRRTTQAKGYVHVLSDAMNKVRQARYLSDSSLTRKLAHAVTVMTEYEKLLGGTSAQGQGKGQHFERVPTDVRDEAFDAAPRLPGSPAISARCENDARRILTGIGENWTISFIDSTGKPGPGLAKLHLNLAGEYKECQDGRAPSGNGTDSLGFKGNYCVLKARPLFLTAYVIQWGVCVPDSCTGDDLDALFLKVIVDANLSTTVIPEPTQCRTDERDFTAATYAAIVIISIIGFLVFLGTFYDIVALQAPQWRKEGRHNDSNISWPSKNGHSGPSAAEKGGTPRNSETQQLLPKSRTQDTTPKPGTCCKFLLAFSVYTNGLKVLSTGQSSDSLGAVHGIRFFSMTWVILGHMFAFGLTHGDFENLTKVQDYLHRWTFAAIANAFPAVDTFFTLSGLLISYLTIKQMNSKGLNINWPMFYFHRFWRLTPPYMLVLVLVLGLQQFMGSGAMWDNVQPFEKIWCEKNWWTNLLYVNNIVNREEMCLGHTWYMADDMQFFVLSPLMMIPFYFNRLAGILSCMVFLLVNLVTTGTLSYHNAWPVSAWTTKLDIIASQNYFMDYYFVPWCRIGPYVIGVMAGYLLAVTRGGKAITMRGSTVLFGWVVAIATGLAVVYGAFGDFSGEDTSSVEVAALYNSMARSVWGVCVAWVIVACAAGYGGPVNTFLSWGPFVFLGRLTYMAYLIHPCIVYSYYQNMEVPFYITDTSLVIAYLGILLFSFMTAFVLMLAFESPMIALEKVFLRLDKKG